MLIRASSETPPHTWRKLNNHIGMTKIERNTSTYVEKILSTSWAPSASRKHLHIRGENLLTFFQPATDWETPPHTWRKSANTHIKAVCGGNTSTYVEKMGYLKNESEANQKHLHIRGENALNRSTKLLNTETPPHTWRKLIYSLWLSFSQRNTSTYVEKMQ